MSQSHLVLDIETVPDDALWSPPEPPPGAERPFPPLYACKPVVIGVLWLDENHRCQRLGIVGEGKDEASMLGDFSDFMARERPRLVTWNGRGFDLPVVVLRALRHGVPLPWYYQDPELRNRRSEEQHLDLGDALADHGAARMTSLHGAARLCGLPGKDGGIDGSQVEGLYRAGQMEALYQYCLSDVAQTAFVFLRYRLLTGLLDRAAYRAAAAALLDTLETDGRLTRLTTLADRRRLLLGD
jgi:predicted PolB exonuclease-like 3'-5' exonuclease